MKVDGTDACHLFGSISACLSTDRLIAGSIEDNIKFFRRDVSNEILLRSLELADATDFVNKLPMGLRTPVSEDASVISSGQRQRLLLARALAVPSKLLVLDESTSHLDVEVENKILSRLRSQGTTLVIISHRPGVWRHADRLIDVN